LITILFNKVDAIMKNETSKATKRLTNLEKGREFLNGFKKLTYNRDRIGQSFVLKLRGTVYSSLQQTDI
jgi:hypothetical protein